MQQSVCEQYMGYFWFTYKNKMLYKLPISFWTNNSEFEYFAVFVLTLRLHTVAC